MTHKPRRWSSNLCSVGLGAALVLVANATAPDVARAQRVIDVGVYAALGVGGSARRSAGVPPFRSTDPNSPPGGAAPNPLRPFALDGSLGRTLGFGLALDVRAARYFSVGPALELLSFKTPDGVPMQVANFDVRLTWQPAELAQFVPYASLPFGASIARLDAIGSSLRDWRGWNVGALVGVRSTLTAGACVTLEVGWRLHQLFTRDSLLSGQTSVVTQQFVVHVGLRTR